jgi:hypothetical protein
MENILEYAATGEIKSNQTGGVKSITGKTTSSSIPPVIARPITKNSVYEALSPADKAKSDAARAASIELARLNYIGTNEYMEKAWERTERALNSPFLKKRGSQELRVLLPNRYQDAKQELDAAMRAEQAAKLEWEARRKKDHDIMLTRKPADPALFLAGYKRKTSKKHRKRHSSRKKHRKHRTRRH